MANKSRNKKNQPPTGEGKKQSTRTGESNKLKKRSTILQAQRGRADENTGSAAEEEAVKPDLSKDAGNPKRPKAGR